VNKKLLPVFLILVFVPMGLLLWVGARMGEYEQDRIRVKFERFLQDRLGDIDDSLKDFMRSREHALQALLQVSSPEPDVLEQIQRSNPLVGHVFFIDPKGRIIYPPPGENADEAQRDFLLRTKEILKHANLFYSSVQEGVSPPSGDNIKPQFSRGHGWYVWFWGEGINVLFWRRDSRGNIIGAELNRIRLISEIIARLPETNPQKQSSFGGMISLDDSKGEALYKWGRHTPGENEKPVVKRHLSYPLNSWTLSYYISPQQMKISTGKGLWVSLLGVFITLGIILFALAIYFYREHSRELREAEKRMSFVNQVSHELKTPLTNIRMYAELLEKQLEHELSREKNHVNVICSESQRLSRMIQNILSFSKKQSSQLTIHPEAGVVDETIHCALEHFEQSLEQKGIKIQFRKGAGNKVRFDSDVLEQILYNLLGNVEKYAPGANLAEISSSETNGNTTIIVKDNGPGIPKGERDKIFQPFYRISNKLTDGITGTGIGLAISRDLARLHGGDLVLLKAEKGAAFQVTLETPPEEET